MTGEISEDQSLEDTRHEPWHVQNAELLEDLLLERAALSAHRMNKVEVCSEAFGCMISVASKLDYQCRYPTKKVDMALPSKE